MLSSFSSSCFDLSQHEKTINNNIWSFLFPPSSFQSIWTGRAASCHCHPLLPSGRVPSIFSHAKYSCELRRNLRDSHQKIGYTLFACLRVCVYLLSLSHTLCLSPSLCPSRSPRSLSIFISISISISFSPRRLQTDQGYVLLVQLWVLFLLHHTVAALSERCYISCLEPVFIDADMMHTSRAKHQM